MSEKKDVIYSMESTHISNARVMEYSRDNPNAIVVKQNKYGEYVCLRVFSRPFEGLPTPYMCIANNELVSRIKNMNLIPGDYVTIVGSKEGYLDENNRHSQRIKLYNIDYGIRTKSNNQKKDIEEQEDTTIDLSSCDIFQKKIE